MKQTKITKKSLKIKLKEALASQSHVYAAADSGIKNASVDHMMGSGVVITITAIGGKELIPPTLIRDGLSNSTISAIREDLVRSYNLSVLQKPSGSPVFGI